MDVEHLFRWQEVHLVHFYIYFVISAFIAFYLTKKSNSRYKFEIFFLAFYLLTGNLNEILTIKIPGFSLLEIQPKRFLFLMLLFFLVRKVLFFRKKIFLTTNGKIPWWEVSLYAYFIFGRQLSRLDSALNDATNADYFVWGMIAAFGVIVIATYNSIKTKHMKPLLSALGVAAFGFSVSYFFC